jgi:hypothetical protein
MLLEMLPHCCRPNDCEMRRSRGRGGGDLYRVKQAQPSLDQQQRCDGASHLGVCCRCVSVGTGWLQGVRRLFAACWLG